MDVRKAEKGKGRDTKKERKWVEENSREAVEKKGTEERGREWEVEVEGKVRTGRGRVDTTTRAGKILFIIIHLHRMTTILHLNTVYIREMLR